MKVYLDKNWTLRGTTPFILLEKYKGKEEELSKRYVTDKIPATVPGGIHLDLYREGIIENPYIDQNSRHCEWTENRWWIYETDVTIDRSKGRKRYLVFDGLDRLGSTAQEVCRMRMSFNFGWSDVLFMV